MSATVHDIQSAGRMSEAEYERERQRLRDLYGDNSKEAAAKRDQAMAILFDASRWTLDELAKKEAKSERWIYYRVQFGQFLNFCTTVQNIANVPADLTEWKFRKHWERTDKNPNDRARFMAVHRLIEAEAAVGSEVRVRHPSRPRIGQPLVDQFADGSWHALETIAKFLDADEDHVTSTLNNMAGGGTYGVEKVESRPYKTSHQYRIFRASRAVCAAEIHTKLDPLITGLEAEGKKNMATMSPGTVAMLAARIRRLVNEWTG